MKIFTKTDYSHTSELSNAFIHISIYIRIIKVNPIALRPTEILRRI